MAGQTCEYCRFWNDGKAFTEFEIRTQKKYGISFNRYRCSRIDKFANDPGYETEGVETSYDFGCVLFESKL